MPLKMCAVINLKSGGKRSALYVQKRLEEELGLENVMVLFMGDSSTHVQDVEDFILASRPSIVIVAGGDGTISFLMDIVKTLKTRGLVASEECHIAPFPLGTGNDMSVTLGFGMGFARWVVLGRIRFRKMMRQIRGAHPVRFDRWKLSLKLLTSTGAPAGHSTRSAYASEKIMNNYFSIGFDATCARNLNKWRQRFPYLFPTRPIVKLWYAVFAVLALFTQRRIGSSITLHIDDHLVEVPASAKALVVLNVQSYAGGSALWNANTDKDNYTVPSIDDGKVEVLWLSGVWHLAMVRMALCHGTKLGQGHKVDIRAPSHFSCQYDGEFIEEVRTGAESNEAIFSISLHSQATILRGQLQPTPHLTYLAVLVMIFCGIIPYLFF